MKIKAFLGKNLLSEIFDPKVERNNLETKYGRRVLYDIFDFIASCDEWISQDRLPDRSENTFHNDLLRVMGKSGKMPTIIKEQAGYKEALENARPFALQILIDDITGESDLNLSPIPSMTITEIEKAFRRSKVNTFPIIKKHGTLKDFQFADFPHSTSSIVLNDRYFFKSSNPELVTIRLLSNFINKKSSGKIILTITHDENLTNPIETEKEAISIKRELELYFPSMNFIVEEIATSIKESHDRILFTDFVCYKSGHSFSFLTTNDAVTSIDRFLLIDSHNFKQNLKVLQAMMTAAKNDILAAGTQNRIIKEMLNII